jgi:hypothetical protein
MDCHHQLFPSMPSPSLFELCLKTRRIQTLLVELERVFYVKENITKKKSGVSKKMNGFWVGLRSASSNKLLCWWGGILNEKRYGIDCVVREGYILRKGRKNVEM